MDESLEQLPRLDPTRQGRAIANQLIQGLIAECGLDFKAVRQMTTEALRRLELRDARLASLRSGYLQIARLSEKLAPYAISPHGPGIAFPAADGGSLTGDPG